MPQSEKGLRSIKSKPCRHRFVNNSRTPIQLSWLDYDGDEVLYAEVQPSCQHGQETYVAHPWRVRDAKTGAVLVEHRGPSATIEITICGNVVVHPGSARHVWPGSHEWPPEWGTYQQRAEVLGLPIMSFACVTEKAIKIAAAVAAHMLQDTPPDILKRMLEAQADIAIIGSSQATSDIPPHSHVKGKMIDEACPPGQQRRSFDDRTRGLGGNVAVPTCSVGEENLLMDATDCYSSESIMVHEFAHSVMNIGMGEDMVEDVRQAYNKAAEEGLYNKTIYMMANADEYWAEGTQSWFDATVRNDVNDGINTREKVMVHDPRLARILKQVFGDGAWRYPHTAPSRFLSASTPWRTSEDDRAPLIDWEELSGSSRYCSLCCFCLPFRFVQPGNNRGKGPLLKKGKGRSGRKEGPESDGEGEVRLRKAVQGRANVAASSSSAVVW